MDSMTLGVQGCIWLSLGLLNVLERNADPTTVVLLRIDMFDSEEAGTESCLP